jgi:RNA polymerase sigma-70 factor (ECF subfamily)
MTIDPQHLQDETARQTGFDALVAAHYETIVRYCVARLGSLQGEDVAQEVFVAAWEGLPTWAGRPALPLAAWLVGIARNKCRDASRTRRRRAALATQFLADIRYQVHPQTPPSAEEAVTVGTQERQQQTQLTASLARLKPEERLCLVWRYIKGLALDDIGDLLGISATAAQRRCHRALQRLRERMHDDPTARR